MVQGYQTVFDALQRHEMLDGLKPQAVPTSLDTRTDKAEEAFTIISALGKRKQSDEGGGDSMTSSRDTDLDRGTESQSKRRVLDTTTSSSASLIQDHETTNMKTLSHKASVSTVILNPEPLDLSNFTSCEELEKLGLDRLKSALMAIGMKCG